MNSNAKECAGQSLGMVLHPGNAWIADRHASVQRWSRRTSHGMSQEAGLLYMVREAYYLNSQRRPIRVPTDRPPCILGADHSRRCTLFRVRFGPLLGSAHNVGVRHDQPRFHERIRRARACAPPVRRCDAEGAGGDSVRGRAALLKTGLFADAPELKWNRYRTAFG